MQQVTKTVTSYMLQRNKNKSNQNQEVRWEKHLLARVTVIRPFERDFTKTTMVNFGRRNKVECPCLSLVLMNFHFLEVFLSQ